MIRRNVLQGDRDQKTVKWALVAATFALSIGCLAEVSLVAAEDADTTHVVEVQKADTAPRALAS